jgi:hypothetical protein
MCDVAALKYAAVFRRSTHNDSLIITAKNGVCSHGSQTSTLHGAITNPLQVDWTFKYHGSASGSILADEVIEHANTQN